MVYFMFMYGLFRMLQFAKTTQHQIAGCFRNDEFERIWKEQALA